LPVLAIIFFAAIAIQVIYLIVFIAVLSRRRDDSKVTALQQPVSVIVCAHDEESNLRELVPMLLRQNYGEFEVIIVDDRSNDGTFDFLLEESRKNPKLRMVHVDRTPPHVNGKKFSLTLGIKAAQFDRILLTDADCRPMSDEWISAMNAEVTDKTLFVLGFSPYVKNPGFLNLFIRFESLVTALQYMAFALLKSPYMGVGRNLSYKKSFFLGEKGFNQFMNITGGDDDLFVNQHARGENTNVVFDSKALMFSIAETSWSDFFRQKRRHLSVGRFYKVRHRFWLGLFTTTWLTVWLLGIPLAIFLSPWYLFAGALLFRALLLLFAVQSTSNKLDQKFEWWAIPFLDFLYSIYYLTTGLFTLGAKKVRWKN
jgi:glycosyltransferase involved in cell wall biosynthesis